MVSGSGGWTGLPEDDELIREKEGKEEERGREAIYNATTRLAATPLSPFFYNTINKRKKAKSIVRMDM